MDAGEEAVEVALEQVLDAADAGQGAGRQKRPRARGEAHRGCSSTPRKSLQRS